MRNISRQTNMSYIVRQHCDVLMNEETVFQHNMADGKIDGLSTHSFLKPLLKNALIDHLNDMNQKCIRDKDSR